MSPSGSQHARGQERKSAERRRSAQAERRREGRIERERAFRLQLLADVGRRTTAILSLVDLLRSSVQIIQETFGYFMVNIFLVDGEDIVLRAGSLPEFEPLVDHLRLGIGREGITGWVAKSGEPLNVSDVRCDPRYLLENEVERRTRSELSVPILLKGAVIGVLDAQSEGEATFNELDVFTLQTVAGQLAVAIENARLYEELRKELAARRRTERLLRSLHVAGLAMEMAVSPEKVFVTVGEELGKVGLLCSLHLVGDDRRQVRLAYASPALVTRGPMPELPPVEGTVFDATPPAVFEKGRIVTPLLLEDRLLGFLTVVSDEVGVDDIPAIQVFANEIAAAWRKAQLVGELRRSLRDLERTQEQLLQSQKMEAVGRLAGGVAHDFNNQLTAIMGYADLLQAGLAEGDPRRVEAAEILRAAGRAAELTRQLLAFSRRQVLRPRVVDLNDLVQEMRGMLQRLIGENIRLRTVCAEGSLRVRADPSQLEQVIMNLAVNARDAMPEGGLLEIATRTEPSYGGPPGTTFHVMRVTDTGTGMSPEVMSRLFEPFFTTKEPGRGTGLGLSTAYGIVKQSGGHITCRSAVSEGTTFEIRLPATMEVPGEPERAPETAAASGKEKILVIEDEVQVRELIQRVLAGAGYSVIGASSGDEAIDLLRHREEVEMVITDLMLPGNVSGIDIARRVMSDERGTRLLCISGYSEQLVSGASGLPATAPLLQKPFSPSDLLRKVRSILDEEAAGAP